MVLRFRTALLLVALLAAPAGAAVDEPAAEGKTVEIHVAEGVTAERTALDAALKIAERAVRLCGDRLGLEPSEVARHMNSSSRQGLVRYDTENNRYMLARQQA